MRREPHDFLKPKDWFIREAEEDLDPQFKLIELEAARIRARTQEQVLWILVFVFIGLLIFTLVTFYLQGFHVGGFNLDVSILKDLGIATIGAVAGLLGISINAVYMARKNNGPSG